MPSEKNDGVREALETVARVVAANAIRGMSPPEWENYPEIAEGDWEQITLWLESHAAEMDAEIDEYSRAYDLLAGRADPDHA